ncbi:SMP-30/gluconolactonase/LRE family protein [Shimazuella kribbensis]|uniref:SMP-30/gluconolactonase/LRE family protein n=1 Tax=Shimazuella kribbensis TaxID=139808 RepID=UPI001470DCB2|nr:SMP-30/gluconolactonase/LRE family protein [Shimazuella kribbensis]
MPKKADIIREGFGYLEGFRWHHNEVWFSDFAAKKVYRMSPDGEQLNIVASLDVKPSGLGFPLHGDPLVVGMDDCTLRRIKADGSTEIVASFQDKAYEANDMWVSPEGRAYISQFGYDLFAGGPPIPSHLIIVHPDGTVEVDKEDLIFPNGIQLTADGETLIVSELFGLRLNAFDVKEDGTLSNRRVIVQFEEELDIMDGLVLDAEGAIWVTMPYRSEVRRITQEGITTDIVKTATEGHIVVSCTLGGEDGRDLYIATANATIENLYGGTARVEMARVNVPSLLHKK